MGQLQHVFRQPRLSCRAPAKHYPAAIRVNAYDLLSRFPENDDPVVNHIATVPAKILKVFLINAEPEGIWLPAIQCYIKARIPAGQPEIVTPATSTASTNGGSSLSDPSIKLLCSMNHSISGNFFLHTSACTLILPRSSDGTASGSFLNFLEGLFRSSRLHRTHLLLQVRHSSYPSHLQIS